MQDALDLFPTWTGNEAPLRDLQAQLARRVLLRDDFAKTLRSVAGFSVGFDNESGITRAAAVLMDAATLEVIDQQLVHLPTRMPDIPGLSGFRGVPALLAALAALKQRPDLALIDGQGIAHPRRFGSACHFGLAANLPTIGIGTSVLIGSTRLELHAIRGAFTPLRDGAEQIGWLLRSQPGVDPIVISPGHRVAMASAPGLAMQFTSRDRLPEPIRLADRLASQQA
ncbi:deoxyribonuclease V [Thermomonas sp.]|uniref:deoxyribonuclease V n=1 Tax=Thermomonas sp. TaxID=1971895 RepID=UPI002616100D|nr:deoxyribonuclease V [Thermomonas sp.]MCO5056204.1 deoxyribonuclease V [Thermomonas sp.]